MIKYLGSKRVLVPHLVSLVDALPNIESAFDAFSGTSRVGHALKSRGIFVSANDHNTYAHTLAQCYVEADRRSVLKNAKRVLAELSGIKPKAGWFTETYSEHSRYFHPKNGARIDAMRERIEAMSLPPSLKAVVLVSLMEAADRVDSTVGVQMAYLKTWAARAHNDLELRMPDVLNGKGRAYCLDAAVAAKTVGRVDLAYLDPPYNQHSYRGNYHVWESLVRWDKPDVYGIAKKRDDVREKKSAFNSKRTIHKAFEDVLASIDARFLVVSFNNEGYMSPDAIEGMLRKHGRVDSVAVDFKRYVGARIGIYNPDGEKVGKVGRLTNQEHLFLVDCDGELGRRKSVLARAVTAAHP